MGEEDKATEERGRRKADENQKMLISCVLIVTGKVTDGEIVGGSDKGLIVGIGVLRVREGNI